MAITLLEAKVGMADKVDAAVVDMFRRSSTLLDAMPFDNAISPGSGGSTLSYGYIQLKTPGTAAVRTVGENYTAAEAKKEKKTTCAIIMGGAFEVDRVVQNTSGAADEISFQAEQKIKATANYFHNLEHLSPKPLLVQEYNIFLLVLTKNYFSLVTIFLSYLDHQYRLYPNHFEHILTDQFF